MNEESVDFALWNLSGQLVGYQRYRPSATKHRHNDELLTKYYTYSTLKQPVFFGCETLSYRNDVLFVVEGMADSVRLHNYNLPAVAVLSNNPKPLRNQLRLLPHTKVVVADDDVAGRSLKKFGDYSMQAPAHRKDLGECTEDEVRQLVGPFL